MSIAATIAGALTMVAFWMRFSLFFGGFGRRGGSSGAAGLLVIIVISILVPIAAMIIKLAISRSREYQADASGGRLGSNPLALARALEKLEAGSRARPMEGSQGVSYPFIVNPLKGSSLSGLLSTHPPIQERIRRLRKMADQTS